MSSEKVLSLAQAFVKAPSDDAARALAVAFSRVSTASLWREIRDAGVWLWSEHPDLWPERCLWDVGSNPEGPILVTFPSDKGRIWDCTLCGKRVEDNWGRRQMEKEILIIRRDHLCFTCAFWRYKTEDRGYMSRVAVIDGRAHHPESVKVGVSYERMLGCGGARVTIRYHDGRVVRTNDLWVQGDIPDHFREHFPDNAVFDRESPEDWLFAVHEDKCWTQGEEPGDWVLHPRACGNCRLTITGSSE